MALISSGVFRGIPLQNAYIKIINIAFASDQEFYIATMGVYSSKDDATNFPVERALDRFTFEFPANRNYTDIYTEVYSVLKNRQQIVDRLKYDEFGNLKYTNTQYFPELTTMVDD
jgi:hypothetical protein